MHEERSKNRMIALATLKLLLSVELIYYITIRQHLPKGGVGESDGRQLTDKKAFNLPVYSVNEQTNMR